MSYIPNGFDEQMFEGVTVENRTERNNLQFAHFGLIGVHSRGGHDLITAFGKASGSPSNAGLLFYGNKPNNLAKFAREVGLHEIVEFPGACSHDDALKRMMNSDALVLYQNPSSSPISAIAGKTYEYLRSGRPILAICPEGDNAELVRRYGQDSHVVTSYDQSEMVDAVKSMISKIRSSPRRNGCPLEYRQRFDRRKLTGNLAALFEKIVIFNGAR
jgi:glycosyltransferase involved in cell wall biosynthesis